MTGSLATSSVSMAALEQVTYKPEVLHRYEPLQEALFSLFYMKLNINSHNGYRLWEQIFG